MHGHWNRNEITHDYRSTSVSYTFLMHSHTRDRRSTLLIRRIMRNNAHLSLWRKLWHPRMHSCAQSVCVCVCALNNTKILWRRESFCFCNEDDDDDNDDALSRCLVGAIRTGFCCSLVVQSSERHQAGASCGRRININPAIRKHCVCVVAVVVVVVVVRQRILRVQNCARLCWCS